MYQLSLFTLLAQPKHFFFLLPTNILETTHLVKDLKTSASCGFDGISSTVAKSAIPFIAEPLA